LRWRSPSSRARRRPNRHAAPDKFGNPTDNAPGQKFDAPDPSAPAPKAFAILVGGHYNPDASPKFGATIGGLYPVSANDALGVIADITAVPGVTTKGNRLKTNIRFEYVRKAPWAVSGWPIYILADVGGTFEASDPTAIVQQAKALITSGTNAGYQAATGIATERHLWKSLYLAPALRVVKGSLDHTTLVGGINLEFKGQIERK
jgi:hypothetical protein